MKRKTGRIYDGPQILEIITVENGWNFIDESRGGLGGYVPWPDNYAMSIHNLSELDIFNHVLYCYDHGSYVYN